MASGERRQVLFPNGYTWFVFLSSLDIILTWVVLHLGGREVNALADRIIWRWGLPGLVTYKFLLVTLVIVLCESVGRRNPESARKLLAVGIVVTCLPVALALLLLLIQRAGMLGTPDA